MKSSLFNTFFAIVGQFALLALRQHIMNRYAFPPIPPIPLFSPYFLAGAIHEVCLNRPPRIVCPPYLRHVW